MHLTSQPLDSPLDTAKCHGYMRRRMYKAASVYIWNAQFKRYQLCMFVNVYVQSINYSWRQVTVSNHLHVWLRLFWCLFNKYQNKTRMSAETVRHESTYIISFLTRHNESINYDKKDDIYALSRVSLARFSSCWWRHNGSLMASQWPDNCDAVTWMLIFNSLDIDFIHGDIHGLSCKK